MSKASEILQRAFDADPNAMHALTVNRVPCNQMLADDPDVIVDNPPVLRLGNFSVGMLGVLNGILNAIDQPKVAYRLSEEADAEGRRKFLGFCDVHGEVAGSKAKALFERVVREIDLNMREISSESVQSLGQSGVANAAINGLKIAKCLVESAMKEL